jgi:ribosome-binding ATPase YchF (GTP1/OBG family)
MTFLCAALTNTQNAEAANYPFCTIKPNVGLVSIRKSFTPILGCVMLVQHTSRIYFHSRLTAKDMLEMLICVPVCS